MDNLNSPKAPVAEPKNRKIFIVLGFILIGAIIITVFILNGQDKGEINTVLVPEDAQPYTPLEESQGTPVYSEDDFNADDLMMGEMIVPEVPEILREAVIMVEGADLIAKDGTVINTEGVEVVTDISPSSVNAPRQTDIVSKEAIPESAIKLDLSATGFNPSEFTVKAGAPITLSVSADPNSPESHSLRFDSKVLSAVAISIGPGQTRAMTFNAPEAGSYSFRCDVPGHKGRGEKGVMIVK